MTSKWTLEELAKNEALVACNPKVFCQSGTVPAPKLTGQQFGTKYMVIESKEPEKDFQKWLLSELHKAGWRAHAERSAMTSKGYRTPIQGDAGYPDITAVRAPRFLLAELKSDSGQASPNQVEWLLEAGHCPSIEVKIWSPKDREAILEWIK